MTVFLTPGDKPMSYRQAIKRGLRHFNSEKAQWVRETGIVMADPDYMAWAAQWLTDNQQNEQINLFNHGLANYRKALTRLVQYEVSVGRDEVTEQLETGEFDEATGDPITETVIVVSAVEALDATVDQNIIDEATGEVTGTETVPNPLIVADEAERAAAQVVIDNTPASVKGFG